MTIGISQIKISKNTGVPLSPPRLIYVYILPKHLLFQMTIRYIIAR